MNWVKSHIQQRALVLQFTLMDSIYFPIKRVVFLLLANSIRALRIFFSREDVP